MGVGSNPTFWFVAVTTILIVVRYLLDSKEVTMSKNTDQLKTNRRNFAVASLETIWVIATNITVGLVTLSIH